MPQFLSGVKKCGSMYNASILIASAVSRNEPQNTPSAEWRGTAVE